ncbi:MAG: hypothetical protein Fues2KO_17520 [Fuerstiella sp.]
MMHTFGILLLWLALQVTLVAMVVLVSGFVLRTDHRPSTTATSLSLLLIIGLSAAAISPWPRWSLPTAGSPQTIITATDRLASSTDRSAAPNAVPAETISDVELQSPVIAAWQGFINGLADPQPIETAAETSTPWTWPAWMAFCFVGLLVLFAIRLLAGWLSLQTTLKRARRVQEPALTSTVQQLAMQLRTPGNIAVYESTDVVSAATVGWRAPIILLPDGWRSWDLSEQRTVLSHELAHIRAKDSLTWLIAQFTLLLHFYHPLVHLLVRRLRLEQELAADAVAAQITGGSKHYLMTLAGMAVRQPQRTVAWPVRPFLPIRGTLMRRIDMLQNSKDDSSGAARTGSNWRRRCLVAATLATGFLAIGLRPQMDSDVNAAEPAAAAATTTAADQRLNLEHVSEDVVMLVALSPADLAAKKELQPMVGFIEQNIKAEQTGMKLNNIQQFLLMVTPRQDRPNGPPAPPVIEVRMADDTDFQPYIQEQLGSTEKYAVEGVEVFCSGNPLDNPNVQAIRVIDGKTLLQGRPQELIAIKATDVSDNRLPVAIRSIEDQNPSAVFALDVAFIRPIVQEQFMRRPNPFLGMVSPLWQNSDRVVAYAAVDDSASFQIHSWSDDQDAAKKVHDTVSMLIPAAKGMLQGAKASTEQAPEQMKPMLMQGMEMAEGALNTAKVSQDGTKTILSMNADSLGLATMTGMLLPAVQQAREAARRTQSKNNLKQIMLAMHNYHAVYGTFPPAVLLGPDGKTKYSWRVAILPFIDQNELYEQYDRNEPWDSDNNKKVLAQIPPSLKHPSDTKESLNASYYVYVGENTGAGNTDGEGNLLRSFRDGTSNTVMVVEAKKDIPWTKPEDIAYDPEKQPELGGGWHPNGFNAGLADGSVRFISEAIDKGVWRMLIERNDGQVIPQF